MQVTQLLAKLAISAGSMDSLLAASSTPSIMITICQTILAAMLSLAIDPSSSILLILHVWIVGTFSLRIPLFRVLRSSDYFHKSVCLSHGSSIDIYDEHLELGPHILRLSGCMIRTSSVAAMITTCLKRFISIEHANFCKGSFLPKTCFVISKDHWDSLPDSVLFCRQRHSFLFPQ